MIVYNKKNGNIIANIPDSQNIDICFKYYPDEFKKKLASLFVNNPPRDLNNYKVINNELIKMSEQEILEIRQYGKILTEEERLLNKLKPSPEEVKKAEQTIEILTLIQEVI